MSLQRKLAVWVKESSRRIGWDIRRSATSLGEMPSFLRLLKRNGLQPSIVLDVGANKAQWSQEVRQVFPDARFTLVEPLVEMQPGLEAFCAESPGSRAVLAGAGPSASEMELTVWPGLAGSVVLPSDASPGPGVKRRVPIVTIDSLFDDHRDLPQLAKLDIQGFELEALAGATKLWGHTECFILEVSLFQFIPGRPVFADIVDFMRQHNYKVYDMPGYLRRPLDGALGQIDLAFALVGGMLDRDQRWNNSTRN